MKWIRELFVFNFVGLSIFVVELLFVYFMTESLRFTPPRSYGIALVFTFIATFIFQSLLTFKKHTQPVRRFFRHTVVFATLITTSWFFVRYLVFLNVNYILSILISATLLLPVNFVANKLWVYKAV